MAEDLQPLLTTAEGARKIGAAARRKYKGSGGIEVTQSPDGSNVSIALAAGRGAQPNNDGRSWDALILSATAINGGIRFLYTIQIGHWNMAGQTASVMQSGGVWVADSGAALLYAYNSVEDKNTFTSGTGAIGTGNTNVTQSDGTINGSPCKLVKLAGYVAVKFRGIDSQKQVYYTITNFSNSSQ